MQKSQKAFASFRLFNEVKAALEREAVEKGLSFSRYIQDIISNRLNTNGISDEERIYLQNKVDILEKEKTVLLNELKNVQPKSQEGYEPDLDFLESVELENRNLSAKLKELENRQNVGNVFNFSDREQAIFIAYFKKMQKLHPGTSKRVLLLGALDTTLRAESAFWFVPTINNFLHQNIKK